MFARSARTALHTGDGIFTRIHICRRTRGCRGRPEPGSLPGFCPIGLLTNAPVRHNDLMSIPLLVRRLPHAEGLPLPSYATAGAAGMDLIAAIQDPISVQPGERALIPTGLTIALPPGYELQIRPRSGLALRHGITLPNSPGTIDEDYRGEIGVIVLNTGTEAFLVERGTRIAQAVLAPVSRAVWSEVQSLEVTTRNAGGFGSTGIT
jgi:dUTP pyrophosphatase